EQDVKSVAHEVVREVGLKQAATLGNAISFVNELDNYPYRSLEELSHTLNATLKEQMEENWDSDGLALAAQEGQNQAMRLVLKEPSLGIPGTHANLAMVLNLVKQSDEYSKETGILNWVLGGGLAVELQTNQYTRDHKDIDMLCLASEPSFLDTDKVRAGDYFGVISSDSEYISEHCVDCVDW
ncbi:MAG: hypothetical protein OXU45_03685, partial [Candidatus Melainabacteria bacterium]|nr:hypothetical protein [Candidatus Melainabacteria bacterium]